MECGCQPSNEALPPQIPPASPSGRRDPHLHLERGGFKTEKDQTAFQVQNGGQLEVLGGIINQYCQAGACTWGTSNSAPAAVEVYGSASKASIVAATNGPSSMTQHFTTLIKDTQGATVNYWYWNNPALPDRLGRDGQEIIPLYVSY